MIEVVCSQCQKRYRTDSKYVGKRVKCGSCGHPIAIVEPGPPPMPVASATSDTTSAVSDSVPEIRTASLSPIASVLTGIELTWLGLLITSAIVLAPYPAAGQPWPTHIPTLFGSGPAVTKGIIAVFVALGIAGALLIAGWTNHWKMPPLVTRALQFGGFFMLTTAVIALIQLLHIYNLAELVTAHNTQFGRLGNYANPVVLPDSDPTWLVSRAVLILALAAFCGLMIAWTGLVRRGSLTATIWAASVCGIIFLLTVIYFTFGPGGQLIAALIYIAPAPYHHIMPLHTRIRILAGLLSWLILSTITIAILGMVLFDHSRERLKATPATYLRPWQIFQDSALIAVAGGVLAVAIIEQLANIPWIYFPAAKDVKFPALNVALGEFLQRQLRPNFVIWVASVSLACGLVMLLNNRRTRVNAPSLPLGSLAKPILTAYAIITVLIYTIFLLRPIGV